VPNTTPATTNDDTTENWEQRYAGLQKVLAKRDTELTTAQAALDALRAEHEQADADLATYRQRDVDASEEEQARTQYEALRERFEAEPPTPVGNNQQRPARGWEDGSESAYAERERAGTSMGWPI
jgi:chromosome segregation ATPase